MKKVLLVVLVVIIAAAYLIAAKSQVEIRITKEQIQTRLEKQFPYEKKHLILFKTVLAEPRVLLEKGNDFIGFGCSISVFLTGVETLKSKFYAETDIHYNPEERAVYLTNLKLKKFELRGLPPETEKIVRKIVSKAALETLTSAPVYRLGNKSTQEKIAGAIFKDIEIRDGEVVLAFGL